MPSIKKEEEQGIGDRLYDYFKDQKEKLTGFGMARKGGDLLSRRAYQLYSQEAQANGDDPMSYEDWLINKSKDENS